MRSLRLLGTVEASALSTTLNFAAGIYTVDGTGYVLSAVPGLSITGPSQGGYAETSAGALTTFAANAARVTDLGLLIEQASTNLMPSGELPAGTSGQTDPSGSTGAVQLSSSGGYYWNGGPVVDGTTQTLSWYIQSAGSNPAQFLQFAFNPSFTGYQSYANFDIINGTVTQSYGCTASIQQLESTSWYRCIISFTSVINYYELFCYWNLISSGTQGWFGSNVSTAVTFNYWCFQQENGSAASSPILSNAFGTATRSADAATYTYSPAASSASVVTAEGSNSVSPTSPIDFGADTGGAWVGGFVQSLDVSA
jgi:hypothetical protein